MLTLTGGNTATLPELRKLTLYEFYQALNKVYKESRKDGRQTSNNSSRR